MLDNPKKGFTLLEMLIALALVGILLGTANVFLYTTLRNARKASALSSAKSAGSYAVNSMVQMIRYARSAVCTPTPNGNLLTVTRGTRDIVGYDFDIINYTYDVNNLLIASTSGNPSRPVGTINLTPADIAIAPCAGGVFTCSNQTVSICFTARSTTTDATDPERGVVQMETQVTLRSLEN